jgi:hypothetical protein
MRWIEWDDAAAQGVYQQLLAGVKKNSAVIWMVEPPPYIRLACTGVETEAVRHYLNEGGVPIGWVDVEGKSHSFKLEPPFQPPNFRVSMEDGTEINHYLIFTDEYIGEMYDALCLQNMRTTTDA